jgi:hypothetical protein
MNGFRLMRHLGMLWLARRTNGLPGRLRRPGDVKLRDLNFFIGPISKDAAATTTLSFRTVLVAVSAQAQRLS